MPVRSKLSRYGAVYAIAARDLFGYGGWYIAVWILTTITLAATVMGLYVGAYRVAPQSLPLAAALWSIAIASFLRLTWRHLSSVITDDIRSGDIALRIRYPFAYLGYVWADHAGRSMPTAAPFLALAAYLFSGLPTIPSPELAIPLFLVMVAGSFLLSALLYTLMGLLAFWMEDASPVVRIVEKAMVVLGGSIIPIALLPSAARNVLEFIPLTATGFPAQVTSPDFLAHAPKLLAIEYGWIVACAVVVALVWRRARQRIEVNGG